MIKALIITPSAIKIVFSTIESAPIISIIGVKIIVQGIATITTKIPDKFSVAIVANMTIKAIIEITPYRDVTMIGNLD
jgi:hypothetical protein